MFIQTLISANVNSQIFNTDHLNELCSTTFLFDSNNLKRWEEIRIFIWSGRRKPTVYLNGFYNYDVHILRPQNIESGEPELNNVGEKSQDNNELILQNTIINEGWNKITDMIQEFTPLFQ